MCLLAVYFRAVSGAPVLIAANREEAYNRPTVAPAIQPGEPAMLCGLDARAGGTWLGVNRHGLAVAVTNRPKSTLPAAPRSRGLLCLDLLRQPTAAAAVEHAVSELKTGRYAGANYVCVDRRRGWAVHGGDGIESIELRPGLHLLTNGDLNDAADPRQRLARRLFEEQPPSTAEDFVERAAIVCATGPTAPSGVSIVLRSQLGGTVSSTLIALTDEPAMAIYRYAPGPPDRTAYVDYSHELRRLGGDGLESPTNTEKTQSGPEPRLVDQDII